MYISIPMTDVDIIRDPMNHELIIKIDTLEALDRLIC